VAVDVVIGVVVAVISAALLTIFVATVALRVTGRARRRGSAAPMAPAGAGLARDVELGECSGDAGRSARASTSEDSARASVDFDAESDANSHLVVLRSELGEERQVTAQQLVFGEGIGEAGTLITLHTLVS